MIFYLLEESEKKILLYFHKNFIQIQQKIVFYDEFFVKIGLFEKIELVNLYSVKLVSSIQKYKYLRKNKLEIFFKKNEIVLLVFLT